MYAEYMRQRCAEFRWELLLLGLALARYAAMARPPPPGLRGRIQFLRFAVGLGAHPVASLPPNPLGDPRLTEL